MGMLNLFGKTIQSAQGNGSHFYRQNPDMLAPQEIVNDGVRESVTAAEHEDARLMNRRALQSLGAKLSQAEAEGGVRQKMGVGTVPQPRVSSGNAGGSIVKARNRMSNTSPLALRVLRPVGSSSTQF